MKIDNIIENAVKAIINEGSEIDQLRSKLKVHDWYYQYSDDHRYWKAGTQSMGVIRDLVSKINSLGLQAEGEAAWKELAPDDHKDRYPKKIDESVNEEQGKLDFGGNELEHLLAKLRKEFGHDFYQMRKKGTKFTYTHGTGFLTLDIKNNKLRGAEFSEDRAYDFLKHMEAKGFGPNIYGTLEALAKGKKLKGYNTILMFESINEGEKYEEVEWIAPTKTFDYFGTKMTIKKGEKGLLISHESSKQYLVEFQDMRFYAMDGVQVKTTGNSITESVNEGVMSDIHMIAQEASTIEEFIKEFMADYGDKFAGASQPKLDKWLADLYTDAKSMKEGKLNENRGQDEATDLIRKIRKTIYPKLSDLELDAFKNEMGQHFNPDMHMNESAMSSKTESITKRLKEDTEYQEFFKSTMHKFGVKSPKELKGKKKDEFFNYVDKNYKAKSE